jgi:hypothetical protein
MAQPRRPLVEGLRPATPADPAVEREFVHGPKAAEKVGKPTDTKAASEAGAAKGQKPLSRVPFTTRVREDFATALKRASLERQLNNQTPNTLQDILEEALEPWLRTHGYIQ